MTKLSGILWGAGIALFGMISPWMDSLWDWADIPIPMYARIIVGVLILGVGIKTLINALD